MRQKWSIGAHTFKAAGSSLRMAMPTSEEHMTFVNPPQLTLNTFPPPTCMHELVRTRRSNSMFLSVSDSISFRITSYTSMQWTTWERRGEQSWRHCVQACVCWSSASFRHHQCHTYCTCYTQAHSREDMFTHRGQSTTSKLRTACTTLSTTVTSTQAATSTYVRTLHMDILCLVC